MLQDHRCRCCYVVQREGKIPLAFLNWIPIHHQILQLELIGSTLSQIRGGIQTLIVQQDLQAAIVQDLISFSGNSAADGDPQFRKFFFRGAQLPLF